MRRGVVYQEFGSGRQGWYALNQGRGTRKGHKSVSIRQPCWGVRMEWGTGSLWAESGCCCLPYGLQAGKVGSRVCRGTRETSRSKANLRSTLLPSLGLTSWGMLVP